MTQLPDQLRAQQLNLLRTLDFDPLHLDICLSTQLRGDAFGIDRASSTIRLASALASSTRLA